MINSLARVSFLWNTNDHKRTLVKMAAKRRLRFVNGPLTPRRRIRRRLVTPSPRRSVSLAVRRRAILGRLGGRLARGGLKGLAIGAAARAVIGTARMIRKAKKRETLDINVIVDTVALSNSALTDIPKQPTIDARERHNVQLSGFRIKGEIMNMVGFPLYVNVAIVSNRDLGGGSAADEFFRNDGETRSVDFSDALSAMEIHGNPLNTDKFAVLKHMRYRLNANQTAAINPIIDGSGRHYMNIDWYQKINRNIQYDGDTSASIDATSNIQLLWWVDEWGRAAGEPSVNAACRFNWKVVAYHHDS